MSESALVLLLPDARPLITLAYANALNLLLLPGWSVQIVDMVLYGVKRNQTPTSEMIAQWVRVNKVHVVATKTLLHFSKCTK